MVSMAGACHPLDLSISTASRGKIMMVVEGDE